MSACPDDVDQELLAGIIAHEAEAEHLLGMICPDARVLAIVNALVLELDRYREALEAIAANDELAEEGPSFGLHAYRHRRDQARWALRRELDDDGLVERMQTAADREDRADRLAELGVTLAVGPTSPEYQQVVDRLFDMADEIDRMKAAFDKAVRDGEITLKFLAAGERS